MSKKIKTVLFGTGGAAEAFLKKERQERVYIAAVDNDINKHGKLFHDLKIISPSELTNYEYDEIIVASFFGLEIQQQLLEMQIPKSKITLPSKSLIKPTESYPFYDEATLNLAREITKTLALEATKRKIPLHIDWGTLLGVVRDGDIIRWDDDVDFSSIIEHYDSVKTLVKESVALLQESLNLSCSLFFGENKIVIKLDDDRYRVFSIDIEFKIIKDNMAYQSSNEIWYNPAKHIEKLDISKWDDIEIYIPSEVEDYLTFTYGDDWKTPKKDLSLNDYNLENLNLKAIK